jgi:predicted enzyme related to lactoylglutathione lyase
MDKRSGLFLLAALTCASASAAERYWPPITEAPTQISNPGRFVWADLVTDDVGAAAEFYAATFGWTYRTYGGSDDRETYTLVLAGETAIGGMVFHEAKPDSEQPSARWIGMISTENVKATTGKVEAAGGKTLVAPRKVGERGEVAVFADPEGALFGVLKSATGDPEDFLGQVGEWVWIELWVDDAAKATDFYKSAFGYGVEAVPESPREAFRLMTGERFRAGVTQKNAGSKLPSVWLPYVRVADAAATVAKAKAAGGRVLLEPRPYSGATVALIVDPSGAPFAIAQLAAGGK